jgi:hypothetical protein
LAQVAALLHEVYGTAASMDVDAAGTAAVVTVEVPHELA